MGWSKKRTYAKGRAAYTAIYRDIRGVERSAGTFSTRKEADKAWTKAETRASEGRANPGEPRIGSTRVSCTLFYLYLWGS